MPAKSAKQLRFMMGIAHGMKPKHGVGPSEAVAKEFVEKTPKKLFKKEEVMFNWLHHIFNPHCPECKYDSHYLQEKLSLLLEQERAEKFRLLELLAPNRDVNVTTNNAVDISSLRRNPRTIMREMEANSAREAAQIRRRTTEEHIAEVEEQLGVVNNG